jgi:hypothetical protein
MNKHVWLLGLILLTLLMACGSAEETAAPTPTQIPSTETAMAATATSSEEAGTGDSANLEAIAQAFVDQLAQGEFEEAVQRFDDTMAQALPALKLQETWEAVVAQVGSFQELVATRTMEQQGYDVVLVTTQFQHAQLDVRVVFDDQDRIAGLFFVPAEEASELPEYTPPAYVDRSAFEEQEITVGIEPWTLPGTLSLPTGEGPFPGVVLVHGSGPNDRDETIGPNKPFRDLAWGLASQGIAVLRYEKRTREYATELAGTLENFTVNDETVEDARAAVALLSQTEKVDPDKIYVLGHSLGGTMAPRIAELSPEVDGLIIMAGSTRPLEDLVLDQTTYLFNLDETLSEEEQEQLETLEEQVARVKDPALSANTPASELPLEIPAAYWLDLRDYQPALVAEALPQPMLILQGSRDYQVTEQDFQIWQETLSERQDVTLELYPDLNHLFMTGEGPGSPQEYQEPGHVVEQVIQDIAAWIKK